MGSGLILFFSVFYLSGHGVGRVRFVFFSFYFYFYSLLILSFWFMLPHIDGVFM